MVSRECSCNLHKAAIAINERLARRAREAVQASKLASRRKNAERHGRLSRVPRRTVAPVGDHDAASFTVQNAPERRSFGSATAFSLRIQRGGGELGHCLIPPLSAGGTSPCCAVSNGAGSEARWAGRSARKEEHACGAAGQAPVPTPSRLLRFLTYLLTYLLTLLLTYFITCFLTYYSVSTFGQTGTDDNSMYFTT